MDVRNRIASHSMAVSLQVDIKVNRIDLEGVPIEDIMKPAAAHSKAEHVNRRSHAYFNDADLTFALVTKLTGELMGAIRKSDLQSYRHE